MPPPAPSPADHSAGRGYTGPRDALTPAYHQAIAQRLRQQVKILRAQGRLAPATSTRIVFGWPLRPAHGLADYGYHGISNFVDHDPNFPDQLLDYHGGDRTYDSSSGYNHAGTDFFLWPFAWNKMDADLVEVVAAAPGVIVDKTDGNYDRSCVIDGSSPWNAVYVRHADGSVAWYGHLKNGSLTAKAVGEPVAAGETLGVVGSSGSSDAPHLHFELYNADGALLDPFSDTQDFSWWASQPAYYDSAVNRVGTLSAPPAETPCPQPETPAIQDSFTAGDSVYVVAYYRDLLDSQASQYAIYRPDGTAFDTWTESFSSLDQPHYPAYYSYYWRDLPDDAPSGTWYFEVTFQGRTYRSYFNVGAPTTIAVTSPSGGEQWDQGLGLPIHWDDNIGGDVTLQLFRHGDYVRTISAAAPSTGGYLWLPSPDLPTGGGYSVRVINAANPAVYDDSNSFALVATTLTNLLYLPQIQR